METVFRAIADPTRRGILDSLAKNDGSVMELAKGFEMSLPAVSQHLKVLREANLITGHRKGRQIFYHLNPDPLRQVFRWIRVYEKFWENRLDALDSHLRKRHG